MSSKTGTMGLTKPDVNDKVSDTIAALAANFGILDAMYPIGTIYQSTKSTNPSTFLGGTWTALTGRFLVGAGTDYPAGTTGGEATLAGSLRARGQGTLADALDAEVRDADLALRDLTTADRARLLAVAKRLAQLKYRVEEEVAPALGVSIGFSDADGD